MLRKVFILFILLNTFFSNTIIAEEKCPLSAIEAEISGCDYLCLKPVLAKEMFVLYETYPDLQLRLGKSLELLEVRADTIQLMANIHINLGDQKIVLQEEVIGLRNTINTMDAWYKSPYLWACVGIVLGVGLTVGVTYAVNGG